MSAVIIRPLEEATVRHVAVRMRADDRREIAACVARFDPAEIAARVTALSRFGGVAVTDAGAPAAVVCAAELHPGVYQAAMFATDDWPCVALGLTRWIRRTMVPAMRSVGGHRAECRSIIDHRVAHRWLESLGFVREAVLPDFGSGREAFVQYAWRLSDHESRGRIASERLPLSVQRSTTVIPCAFSAGPSAK